MDENERMKKKIRDRLKSLPSYKLYCQICGKYACTATREISIVHYDCWRKYGHTVPKNNGCETSSSVS